MRIFRRAHGSTSEPEYLGKLTVEQVEGIAVLATISALPTGELCFTIRPGPLDKMDTGDVEAIVDMVRKCLMQRVRPQG